jgi:hypothetical protein
MPRESNRTHGEPIVRITIVEAIVAGTAMRKYPKLIWPSILYLKNCNIPTLSLMSGRKYRRQINYGRSFIIDDDISIETKAKKKMATKSLT